MYIYIYIHTHTWLYLLIRTSLVEGAGEMGGDLGGQLLKGLGVRDLGGLRTVVLASISSSLSIC